MDLHEGIIEAGLNTNFGLFLKVGLFGTVDFVPTDYWREISGLKISDYLTSEQAVKLEKVLKCYKDLDEQRIGLAFPPSIGRGGIEQALSISDEELEKLIQKANIKKLGKKFGL
jgi:hypothetical protein